MYPTNLRFQQHLPKIAYTIGDISDILLAIRLNTLKNVPQSPEIMSDYFAFIGHPHKATLNRTYFSKVDP